MQRQRTHTGRDITLGPRRILRYPRRLLGALISAITLAVITACSGSGPTDATEEAVAAAAQQAWEDAGLALPAQPTVDSNSERLDGVTQQWHATVTVAITGSESPQAINSLLGDIEAQPENEDEVDVVDLNLESERVLAESISSPPQGGRALALHHALEPFNLTARAMFRSSWLALLVGDIDRSTAEFAAGLFSQVKRLFLRIEVEGADDQRMLIEQEGARIVG